MGTTWLDRTLIKSVHGRIIVWWSVLLLAAFVLKPHNSADVDLKRAIVPAEKPVRFAAADQVSEQSVHAETELISQTGVVKEQKGKSTKAVTVLAVSVDINCADKNELCTIKGVGPVLAQRIIEYRNAHGPFSSVDELSLVKGIGAKTVEKLKIQKVRAGK